MAPSADRRHRRRGSLGFTLLEIMVTVALVGVTIGFVLTIREQISNHAFRATRMMEAMRLGELLLADWAMNPDTLDDFSGTFEDYDPDAGDAFHWNMTVEEFDLSTGRAVEEDDEYDGSEAFLPPDAATVEEDPADDPYTVRRIKLTIYYPRPDADEPAEMVLERYMPMVRDPDVSLGLGG